MDLVDEVRGADANEQARHAANDPDQQPLGQKQPPDAGAGRADGHHRADLARPFEDRHHDRVGHAEDDDAEYDHPDEAEDAVVEQNDLVVEGGELGPVLHLQRPFIFYE